MEIRQRSAGPVTVLDIIGRMVLSDGNDEPLLEESVEHLISLGQRQVVVNLAAVPQIDTSGLSALVGAYLTAVRRDARLALAQPSTRLRQLLGVTGLDTLFAVCGTDEEAIARLAGDPPPAD